MPLWLIKERLLPFSEKLKVDIFKNFFKFAVIRNPYDVVVSSYKWNNNIANPLRNNFTFDEIINELKTNKYSTFRLFNWNRISTKDTKDLLCDSVLSFENLNAELNNVFNFLKIPFSGHLKIFSKVNNNKKKYNEYYSSSSKKIVKDLFKKEIEYFNYKF